jgi:superfamily II DNA/RNA helicase
LHDPVKVAVTPGASTVERVEQRVIRVDRPAKSAVLIDVLRHETIDRALIFTRTKHGADKVARGLTHAGIAAEAIHGNKSQGQRERVLAAFRKGEIRTLVATDIAARGIDVDGISHVVNFDVPNVPETYVHRIGRTARAGAEGIAISLCDGEEVAFLRDIEKLIRMSIPVSDRRTHQAHSGPPHARNAIERSSPSASNRDRHQQHRHGRGSRKQPRHDQPNAGTGEIASVKFLQRHASSGRGTGSNTPRWTGQSEGS